MRLVQRLRSVAAASALTIGQAVLAGRPAHAYDGGQGGSLAQTAFAALIVGAIVGALVLFLLAKRARRRAEHHAELVQLAGVPEDNPHPILRIAASGEVRYANAAANALLGSIGSQPELWAHWQETIRAMRGPGRTERRLEIGDRVYLLSAVTDADSALNVFVFDVTDLFAKERALSQSEARLALVTRTARLGLFEIDVEKRSIAYNDIYSWQLGIGPVSYTESLDLWAERIHPAEREATLRAMQDFIGGRLGRYRMEHRLDNGRGGWFWVSAIAEVTEVEPMTGMPRQIIGSQLDVTELKDSQIALERINSRSKAQLDLAALGDTGSESALFACAAEHAATITGSARGVLHVLDDKGAVEATYRFGPGGHPRRDSEIRLESEIRDGGRAVARLAVAGRTDAYDAEDTASLQILGADAWRLVLRIRQARKLEIQSRVLQSAVNGIVITDPEGLVEWANPAFERITGYSLDEMVGRDLRLLHSGQHEEAFYRRLWETVKDGRSFTAEFINRRKDGSLFTIEQVITPVLGAGGQIEKYIAISEDITERKSVESRLVYLRQHDELTGLLNRASMVDVIDRAIAEQERGGPGFALIYIGLDHFKVVNDRVGRQSADEVLQRIAVILSDCLRPTDNVARCGGDEFVVLQRMAKNADDAANLARRLSSALSSGMEASPVEVRLGASIGISVFPADQGTADELLTKAELAMRRAKSELRGSVRYFTPALQETAQTRAKLASALPAAMREGQISLVYQPLVDLKSETIIGCEALARWKHPELGMVSPLQFIAIAEETGLIGELGLYILHRAIADFSAAIPDYSDKNLTLSVNLSFGQFAENEFVESIRGALQSTGFLPERLELELTESMLALEPERASETTRSLAALGCKLAIDDFGTGYSSLAQLRRFPVDYLKIDRSFVIDLESGEGPQAVVRAAIAMAHSLGMAIIAEGVETPQQAEFLRDAGAEVVQGYLYGKPMPIEDFAAMAREPARPLPQSPAQTPIRATHTASRRLH
jgi:diguanylate cyclase (GGDEF)-like protein/PAS domain S-box-containing protein